MYSHLSCIVICRILDTFPVMNIMPCNLTCQFLAILLALGLSSSSSGQEQETPSCQIRFQARKGDRMIYEVSVERSTSLPGQVASQSSRLTTTEEWKVTQVDGSGAIDFLVTYQKVVYEQRSGNEIRYFDSEEHRDQIEKLSNDPHLFSAITLLGQHFRVRLASSGVVEKIYDFEDMAQTFAEKLEALGFPGGNPRDQIAQGLESETLRNKLSRYTDFSPPKSPIRLGETWTRDYVHYLPPSGRLTEKATFTLAQLDEKTAVFRSASNPEFSITRSLPGGPKGAQIEMEIRDPKIDSTTRFDVQRGLLREGQINIRMTFVTTYIFTRYRHRITREHKKKTGLKLIRYISKQDR